MVQHEQANSRVASESGLFAVQNLDSTKFGGVRRGLCENETVRPASRLPSVRLFKRKNWLEGGNFENAQAAFEATRGKNRRNWGMKQNLAGDCPGGHGDGAAAIITFQSPTNNPVTINIKNRATALLEAAQTELEPLVVKPKPARFSSLKRLSRQFPCPPTSAAPDNK
ncbi:MAG: hypothetical protein CM1200mP29_15950 [Verrucomicrobiota bacterium]|nr:MAG: hypothetical protein CM1200mP29_15950 [Verrucomicrobiota bacterium]